MNYLGGSPDPLDAIDDHIDRWHAGEGDGQSLQEWLGMSRSEYAAFVERGVLPAEITATSAGGLARMLAIDISAIPERTIR